MPFKIYINFHVQKSILLMLLFIQFLEALYNDMQRRDFLFDCLIHCQNFPWVDKGFDETTSRNRLPRNEYQRRIYANVITSYKACQFYLWCRMLFEKKRAAKEMIYSNLYSAQTNFCKVFLTLQKIQDKQRDRNHVSLNHGIYLCSSAHKLLLKWRVNDINLDIHSNHPWVLGLFCVKVGMEW